MNLKQTLAIAIALCALVPCAANAADVVSRKSSDKKIGGKITDSTKTDVTIKPTTGEAVTIPVNDIVSIDWHEAPSELNIGKSDEAAGRFESAVTRYKKSIEDAKSDSSDLMKVDLNFLIARATARAALTDPEQRDEAVKKLAGFLKANPDSFRVFEAQQFLGQVQLAKQDFAAARTAFEAVGQAPWSDYQLSANVNLGRVLMAENKLDEANQAFDGAIAAAGTSPAEVSRKYEAMVGKSRALISQTKDAEALTVLNEVVDKASPDESALLAEAYVLQGNCLQTASKPKEAVLAYLHVDVLFPRESTYHAEALYNLAKLWKVVQHPDRGLEAAAKLEERHPNSEWTKKLGAAPTE